MVISFVIGGTLLKKGGSMYDLLSTAYPNYNWDLKLFDDNKGKGGWGKSQLALFKVSIYLLLPND